MDGLLRGLRMSSHQARRTMFDPTAAARIRKALNANTDANWRQDNRKGREHISDRHRRADALEQLITRQSTGDGRERPQGTTLLLMADYELVDNKMGNPRLADGTPLPPAEFHKMACDADILCGLFREADSEPIWMGHTSRHPNFRPQSSPRSPRPRLHRLPGRTGMVRIPPHRRMATRRPDPARQPGAGLPSLPRQNPPQQLERRKTPRHRSPLPPPTLAKAACTQ